MYGPLREGFIYLFIFIYFFLLLKRFLLIYLFLAVLGLTCCTDFSLVVASGGRLFIAVHGLLTTVASLVVEDGL